METRVSATDRLPLAAAGIAWLGSAGVLLGLAPLRGGGGATLVVLLALLLAPGLLAALALRLHSAWSTIWSGVVACVVLGATFTFTLAGAAVALGWPVEAAATWLVVLEIIPLAAIVQLARQNRLGGFDGLQHRSRTEWVADGTVAFGAVALAATYARFVEPAMPSGDLWYYLSYIDWMAEKPGAAYVPHSIDPEEWNPRLQTSSFLAFEALLARLVRIDANALQVFWSWLPLSLLPLSLAATYALAASLGTGAGTRIALVGIQLLLVYATLGYAFDRETSGLRWPGAVSFLRISQDKVFLAWILAPGAALFAAEWLARGQRRWLTAWCAAGLACVLTHPLGLPFLAMVSLPFAVLGGLTGAAPWRRAAALALLLLPLAAWPWSQRSAEGAPTTLADEAGFERRAHLTHDSLSIVSRERNEYTAHPSLIAHPLLVAGIVCGVGLLPAVRRRADARYAFATTAAPLVMLYTPLLAPLAGNLVTPYLLWRFTWLLPVALALAVAGRTLAGFAEGIWPRGAAVAVVVFAALIAGLSHPLDDLQRTRETLASLRPAPIAAAAASDFIEPLQAQTGGGTVLLDPVLQPLALALAPDLQTGYWRSGSHPKRYAAVLDLFGSQILTPRHLALLRALDVQWIAVAAQSPLLEALALHAEWFEPVSSIETYDLLRIRGLAAAQFPDDPVAAWRDRVAADPNSLRNRNGLVLALLDAGRRAEARQALTELLRVDDAHAASHERLGTLLLEEADYAGAVGHLRQSLKLDPGRPAARNNLAWLLATCPDPALRNPQAALRHVDALLALGPPDAGVLDTIAAAQAASGDFASAIRSAQQSLVLYESGGVPRAALGAVEDRLAGYRAAEAFIDRAE